MLLQPLDLLFLPWAQAGPCSCNTALLRPQVIWLLLDSSWFQCGEIRLLRTQSVRGQKVLHYPLCPEEKGWGFALNLV